MIISLFPNATYGTHVDLDAYKHIRFQGVDIPNITSDIQCVTQDNDGFMWFGTSAYGLIKYDGIRFKYYQNNYLDKHSLISDYINDLYLDSKGTLWVLTRNSISVYNSELDRVENLLFARDFNEILKNANKVYEDRKGNIFIKGARGIISIKYDKKNKEVHWKPILTTDNHGNKTVLEPIDLCFDENNTLLVSANKKLYKKSETDTMLYPAVYRKYPKGYPKVYFDDHCNCYISQKNKLQIIHKNGNSYSNLQKIRNYDWVSSGSETMVSKLHKPVLTEDNRVWSTARSGLGLFLAEEKNKVLDKYLLFKSDNSYNYSIKGNNVNDIYKDKDLNYWVATDKGVSVYNDSEAKFVYIDQKSFGINFTLGINIRSMAVTRSHFLWLSVNTVGVFVLDEKSNLLFIMPKDILPKAKRYSWISVEDDNNIWIGCNDDTQGGLYHLIVPDEYYETLDKSILKTKKYIFKDFDVNQDSIPKVRMVKIDSKNNLWVGTADDGLLRIPMKGDGNLDTTNIFHYYAQSDLNEYRTAGNLIHDMCELSDGSYLFSNFSKGLLKIDSQYKVDSDYKIEYPYSVQANRSVNMIYQDKDDNIWLSTNRYGAVKYNPHTQKADVVNMSKGLPSNSVFSVMTDPYNRFLINTNRGLALYYPGNDVVVGLRTTVDGSEYSFYGPYYKDYRNYYYYSYRGKGLVRIEFKDTSNKKLSSPHLAFTGLRINNKPVKINPNAKTAVLQKAIWQTEKIKLK
ncbi:MAG: hypothetical protein MI922_15665, partial [Bacteroidales bacterium]|nr:hypothetical protein [Bacteroidales bacterium]